MATPARQIAGAEAIVGLSVWATFALLPKVEYLPEGNRNLVFGILLPPPGYNLDELLQMGDVVGLVERAQAAISEEEQLRRFELRRTTAHKAWKLTDEDWRNREKVDVYNEALIPASLMTELQVVVDMIVSGQLAVTDYRAQ